MNTTLTDHIQWRQHHYCNYSSAWYQSNPARTEAINRKEYGKYLHLEKERICTRLQAERVEKTHIWDQKALARYHKLFHELNHSEKRPLIFEEMPIYG